MGASFASVISRSKMLKEAMLDYLADNLSMGSSTFKQTYQRQDER